jgi:hypothetical protein
VGAVAAMPLLVQAVMALDASVAVAVAVAVDK